MVSTPRCIGTNQIKVTTAGAKCLGTWPKNFDFAICISIKSISGLLLQSINSWPKTYCSLGHYEWNDTILVFLCHNCCILKLDKFKSSRQTIQERIFCCITVSIDHQWGVCFWKYHFNMPRKYSNDEKARILARSKKIRDRPIWLFWGRYRYISHSWADASADTDISKIFKSCFLLHYQKYNVFYALPFLQKLKNQDLQARIFEIAAISILD